MTSSPQNRKTTHVLHLASGDLWAGAEVMLYTLAKFLHLDLHTQVTVVLLNHGTLEKKLTALGIKTYVIDEAQFNSFQIFRQLNKIFANTKPDIVHTHRSKENILGGIAARFRHIPSIRTTHGAPEHKPPFWQLPKWIVSYLDWMIGRFFQKNIVAVSNDLSKILENSFHKTKIKIIENGIDIESLARSKINSQTDNNSTKTYRVGIAGRLTPIKRVDLFIESALYFKQNHPELSVQFDIFGDGPLHNDLNNLIQIKTAESFIHLKGHSENIRQDLQTLDALLMTSDHEGLPMVLLETMCLQIPIIAHAVGGIPELLNHGECGILIHEQTAKTFSDAIATLIKQPGKSQQLVQSALKRVNTNYSAGTNADAYLKIYHDLFNQN